MNTIKRRREAEQEVALNLPEMNNGNAVGSPTPTEADEPSRPSRRSRRLNVEFGSGGLTTNHDLLRKTTPSPVSNSSASSNNSSFNSSENSPSPDLGSLGAPASPMSPSLSSSELEASVPPTMREPHVPLVSDAALIVGLFANITDPRERAEVLRRMLLQSAETHGVYMSNLLQPFLKRNFIALLPEEVAINIFSYLDHRSLCRAARVGRVWYMRALDASLWRSLHIRHRYPVPAANLPAITLRDMFAEHYYLERNWTEGRCTTHMLDHNTPGTVTCLALDRDYVFTAGEDRIVKVWSASRHQLLHRMEGHAGGVWALQYNSHRLVSGSTDRTLRVWDVAKGQVVRDLLGHNSTVRCLQIVGNLVVSGSRDSTLRVWDLNDGRCLHVLRGHEDSVRCVEVRNGLIVSGSYDSTVRSWDLETGQPLHRMTGHTAKIYSLAFDGRRAASGSQDNDVRVWDPFTGQCLFELVGHHSLVALLQLRGDTLVSGNADTSIMVWNIETGKLKFDFEQDRKLGHCHTAPVTCLQFDDTKLLSGSEDGCLKMWDMRTGRFVRNVLAQGATPPAPGGDVVWRLQFDETRLAAACQSRTSGSSTVIVMDFDVEGRLANSNNMGRIEGESESEDEEDEEEVTQNDQSAAPALQAAF